MTALPRIHADRSETVLAFPRCPTSGRLVQPHRLNETERMELDRLRWLALRARLAPRPNLERACFLLAGGTDVSLQLYSNAFFRGLAEHASREMVFYRPGTKVASDDETWLLRLVGAWRGGEEKAAGALISWRVREPQRRWMRFLSAGLTTALDEASV